jgi:protocatechuate 3,4-dioxygenase alpha subunit
VTARPMSGRLGTSPSQTVGPYLHIGLTWNDGEYVIAEGAAGAIVISGRVIDGEGEPVPDAMVETWQADPAGRFAHPDDPRGSRAYEGFRGFGRSNTKPDGSWRIVTVKPGSLPAADGEREAPHINVSVFARGLLNRVVTRIYFDDESDANAVDSVLRSVDPQRVDTLVARRQTGVPDRYLIDFVLQGEDETVFFCV